MYQLPGEKRHYQIGIDFSITSPAVFVFCAETEKKYFYSYSSLVKKDYNFPVEEYQIEIEKQIDKKNFQNNFERYNHIADKIWSWISDFLPNIESIGIEDYALHGKGRLADIVECTCLLKKHIYDNNLELKMFAPTSIKKQVGGKGNLKKDKIYERCWNNEELKSVFKELEDKLPKKKSIVQHDLLDAWGVWKMSTILK